MQFPGEYVETERGASQIAGAPQDSELRSIAAAQVAPVSSSDNSAKAEAGPRGWSGRRGSNPRPSAWKADVLPLNYFRCLPTIYHAERGALPAGLHSCLTHLEIDGNSSRQRHRLSNDSRHGYDPHKEVRHSRPRSIVWRTAIMDAQTSQRNCPRASSLGFGESCSGCKKHRIRTARTRPPSDCIH